MPTPTKTRACAAGALNRMPSANAPPSALAMMGLQRITRYLLTPLRSIATASASGTALPGTISPATREIIAQRPAKLGTDKEPITAPPRGDRQSSQDSTLGRIFAFTLVGS